MVTSQETSIIVGLGEVRVTKDPAAVLTCLGLGSCIGVSAYDPVAKVGGMAHIVLPSSSGNGRNASPKYADVGVPLLLREMQAQGALRSRLIVKIAGGAQMSLAAGFAKAFKIGDNNVAAVDAALASERIAVRAAETGGNTGRTVRLYLESGRTIVSKAGSEGRVL